MTSPSSTSEGRGRRFWVALPITLSVLGILLTIVSVSPGQAVENIRDYGQILYPAYGIGAAVAIGLMGRRIARLSSEMDGQMHKGAVLATRDRSDSARKQKLEVALEGARSVKAIGIANNALTSELGVEFYRRFLLQRRGVMRLMFLEPGCASIRERENAEGRQEGTLSLFVEHNLEDVARFLKVCAKDNPKVYEQVSVRLYDLTPALNAVIVDESLEFIHYYGTNTRGYDVPSFVISHQTRDVFQFYLDEFESLWDRGMEWEVPRD